MEQKETVLSAVEQAKEKMNALLDDVSRFERGQFDAGNKDLQYFFGVDTIAAVESREDEHSTEGGARRAGLEYFTKKVYSQRKEAVKEMIATYVDRTIKRYDWTYEVEYVADPLGQDEDTEAYQEILRETKFPVRNYLSLESDGIYQQCNEHIRQILQELQDTIVATCGDTIQLDSQFTQCFVVPSLQDVLDNLNGLDTNAYWVNTIVQDFEKGYYHKPERYIDYIEVHDMIRDKGFLSLIGFNTCYIYGDMGDAAQELSRDLAGAVELSDLNLYVKEQVQLLMKEYVTAVKALVDAKCQSIVEQIA